MDAVIRPYGTLDFLTQREISELSGPDEGPLKKLFHRCALAVLNTGEETDSSLEVMERYREFEIRVIQETRGIKLELKNAPQSAFVDGKLMYSIRDHHLFRAQGHRLHCKRTRIPRARGRKPVPGHHRFHLSYFTQCRSS